jgi:tRNA (guanine37-N1)-methyltransferase
VRFTIITLFPEVIDAVAGASVLGRAQKNGVFSVRAIQLRDFATDKHRSVDDSPAGGGAGMVLKVDVVVAAVRAAIADAVASGDVAAADTLVVFLDPRGRVFDQKTARTWSTTIKHLVLVCGRYEGFDARCFDVDYGVDSGVNVALCSVGDVVLTGGELGALVVVDAVARLLKGALGNDDSAAHESHGDDGLLEHRHYTRPVDFEGRAIPPVLLTGDHKKIAQAQEKDRLTETRARRPDLFVQRQRLKAREKLLADTRVASLDAARPPPPSTTKP